MSNMVIGIERERIEFIRKTYQLVPNRLILNQDDAEVLKAELRTVGQIIDSGPPEHCWIVHGMRVVIDPWAMGIEVAYAR